MKKIVKAALDRIVGVMPGDIRIFMTGYAANYQWSTYDLPQC